MQDPFKWDSYSDQPYQLKDKKYKKKMRKKEFRSLLKTAVISIFTIVFSLFMMPFIKRREIASETFFALGVDFSKESQKTIQYLDDLDVKHILVRFKLWQMDSLDELKEFLKKNNKRKITVKILQDREHIEDLELLKKDLDTIFNNLKDCVDIFEIGSTINRAKWGFFSVDEYNRFFKTAYDLKIKKYKNIQLIGSGVIDFEYHFTAHTLFNFCKYRYDGVSALLYVDRRGAPENTQIGFNLLDKIALLSTMVWLSFKTKHRLYITETNWPISNTAPYAPTSEYECVDEESYANFMLRYYLLAFASQQVDSVYWHQLIATGYGLIDQRDNLRKRKPYFVYKFMIKVMQNAKFLRLDIKRSYYILQCLVDNQLVQIHWSLKDTTLQNENFFTPYSSDGKVLKDKTLKISSEPIYLFIKDAK